MDRGFPRCFIDIMVSWYDGMQCRVRWGTAYSEWFSILAGVRQGGILSPIFYSIYVEYLVLKLGRSNIGCYLNDLFLSILLYADDMAIIAPSVKGLNSLLQICGSYCKKWDIQLNANKSELLFYGKGDTPNHVILMNSRPLE
jgi:hypothetical protein